MLLLDHFAMGDLIDEGISAKVYSAKSVRDGQPLIAKVYKDRSQATTEKKVLRDINIPLLEGNLPTGEPFII